MGGVKAMTDAIITAFSDDPDRTAQEAHASQFKKAEEDWKAYLESSGKAREASKEEQLAAFSQTGDLLGLMRGGADPYAPAFTAVAPVAPFSAEEALPPPTTGTLGRGYLPGTGTIGKGYLPGEAPPYLPGPPISGTALPKNGGK